MAKDPSAPHTPQGGALLFAVFNEIGIIEQLARTRFEAVMPGGLLLPHFSVLNHLVRLGDNKSLKSLAFAFQVSKGTMTNTVQKLAARGLIDVQPDPEDGRGKRVFITQEGRQMREDAIIAITPALQMLAEDVGFDTFEAVLPKLSRIRATLDEMRNP
ncbi:MAG: MarR family transcriptional regulator [Pseudomonadota bacterium]